MIVFDVNVLITQFNFPHRRTLENSIWKVCINPNALQSKPSIYFWPSWVKIHIPQIYQEKNLVIIPISSPSSVKRLAVDFSLLSLSNGIYTVIFLKHIEFSWECLSNLKNNKYPVHFSTNANFSKHSTAGNSSSWMSYVINLMNTRLAFHSCQQNVRNNSFRM